MTASLTKQVGLRGLPGGVPLLVPPPLGGPLLLRGRGQPLPVQQEEVPEADRVGRG